MAERDAEFERELRKALPRGLKGREPELPRTRWAEADELVPHEWDYKKNPTGLFLGYRAGRELGWKDDRHALTVAGTRAGKGTSLIVPNLLLYPGSVLAIDPKGELARITGRRRTGLGKLVVLDPFSENGRWESGSFNPLDELDPNSREVIDEAGAIAQAMVIYSGQGDPHWTSAARALLRALILLVLRLDQKWRNLIAVRDLLMLTHPLIEANAGAYQRAQPGAPPMKPSVVLFNMMKAMGDDFERVVRGQGEAFLDMAEKERESVLSETRTQTQFLDSPALRKVLTKSDFRLGDFKGGTPLSVFLCLPARHMDTHDRWLRVIINLAIGALEPRRSDATDKTKPPVLLLLEEFPVLKHMEKLEAAAGQLAGSGVKLWVIVQNLGQLKRHYQDGWETFIANAGVITAFGNADLETLDYVSRKLGKVAMRVERRSGASSSALLAGAKPTQEDLREWALLDTDEAEQQFAREKLRVLVLAAGHPAVVLRRTGYYNDPRFAGMFDE
jgi:type IV secretion system protein VirD4